MMPSPTRRIFPALLDDFERRLLTQLASDTKSSRSAVIRRLIMMEMARHRMGLGGHDPKAKALARSGR